MAEENKPDEAAEKQALNTEHIKRRLDMLDRRLDNIDSIVTALVERVMEQPITLNITCPRCGKNVEIVIIGSQKPGK